MSKHKLSLLSFLLAAALTLSACRQNESQPDVSGGESTVSASEAATAAETTVTAEESKPVETSAAQTTSAQTAPQTVTTPAAESETENAVTTPQTKLPVTTPETKPPVTTAAQTAPSWSETKTSGVMYVNTDGIYSRKLAIQGSQKVRSYKLNETVNVTAYTDTGYYKLEDGSFIHMDYLSKNKVTAPTPQPPPASSAEQLLNSAPLKPMKTNNAYVDGEVSKILNKIIKPNMTTYQKVVAIYDYIINNFTYQTYALMLDPDDFAYVSDFDSWLIIHAQVMLGNRYGVCDSYTALFVIMTRAIGLESYSVGGTVAAKAGGRLDHAWANIKLNGKYYAFDAQVEQSNLQNGKITYMFFCRGDETTTTLYEYHDRDGRIKAFNNFELKPEPPETEPEETEPQEIGLEETDENIQQP